MQLQVPLLKAQIAAELKQLTSLALCERTINLVTTKATAKRVWIAALSLDLLEKYAQMEQMDLSVLSTMTAIQGTATQAEESHTVPLETQESLAVRIPSAKGIAKAESATLLASTKILAPGTPIVVLCNAIMEPAVTAGTVTHALGTAIAQARIQGDDAEAYFERNVKPSILPEYVLPYVISLLSFRDETPSEKDDQAGMRVLKKRLKNILEPLIESLGSNADNISFLLRCCETVSQKEPKEGGEKELVKMKLVCGETRDVLLSMVQSDVNLASYPGQMFIPQSLFKKAQKKRKRSNNKLRNPAHRLSKRKQPEKLRKRQNEKNRGR